MRIVRFGAVYASAYVLPTASEVDAWSIERPAVYARVSGLPGAFDFYGDNKFPISAFTIRKSALVTAATYAAVETAISALKAATIAVDESKLWALMRDGTTTHWAWAKCISLRISDQKEQIYFIPVEIEFFCREGVWH